MSKTREIWKRFKDSGYAKRTLISLLVGSATAFILFYIFLPPINLMSLGFWVYLTVCTSVYILPFAEFEKVPYVQVIKDLASRKKGNGIGFKLKLWQIITVSSLVGIMILGTLISSDLFNARAYANIIEVEEYDFASDMPEADEVTNIALMDTASAQILGNRVLGSLSDMVSQYTVSDYYTQINYRNTPRKVSNLEYDGFFKYGARRSV